MKFRSMMGIGSVLGVSAAALVGAAPGASGAPSAEATSAGQGEVEVQQVPQAAKESAEQYWTPQRMAQAEPVERTVADDAEAGNEGIGPGNTSRGNRGATGSPRAVQQDPSESPHIGKVFFSTEQGDFVCSGNLVESGNQSTVATAGHCLHDGAGGDFATNFVFAPAYEHGESEHGVWAAEELLTTSQWAEDSEFDYDVGFAVVETKDGTSLEEEVGEASAIGFNQPRNQFFSAYGYPAADRFNGEELYQCQGDAVDDPFGGTALGVACSMTGGSSGGPWFLGDGSDGVQLSVNSYKYLSDSNTMYGPYFGSEVEEVYHSASSR